MTHYERVEDTQGRKVVSKSAMVYCEKQLTHGEIFELQNARNDAKLLAHHYVWALAETDEVFTCAECGRQFFRQSILDAHEAEAHP